MFSPKSNKPFALIWVMPILVQTILTLITIIAMSFIFVSLILAILFAILLGYALGKKASALLTTLFAFSTLIWVGILVNEVSPLWGVDTSECCSVPLGEDPYDKGTTTSKDSISAEKLIGVDDQLSFTYGNGKVNIQFQNLASYAIPDGFSNLVLTMRVENTSNREFQMNYIGWKLLDSTRTEIPEEGVYEPSLKDYLPYYFDLLKVEAGIAKVQKVGYKVKSGTYYVMVAGEVVGKIVIA